MKKQNYVLVSVAVVIIAALIWFGLKKKPSSTEQVNTQTSQQQATTSPQAATSTPPASKPGTKTTGNSNNLTYNQLLAIYGANGNRVQLSQCHGTPAQLVIKQGLKYMLDNRDNEAHVVRFGSQSVSLPKYGFAILTAGTVGTFNAICDQTGSFQLVVEP